MGPSPLLRFRHNSYAPLQGITQGLWLRLFTPQLGHFNVIISGVEGRASGNDLKNLTKLDSSLLPSASDKGGEDSAVGSRLLSHPRFES